MTSPPPLLRVRNLVASFRDQRGERRVVDDVSFDIRAGSHVALMGASGCGKTVMALSIFGLLPSLHGHIDSGQVLFDGVDLLALSEARLATYQGGKIAMVFQDPGLALHPAAPVGRQITEAIRSRRKMSFSQAREIGMHWLHSVGIAAPLLSMNAYPHELSVGSRRRVMMAMALACEPDLLLADDPTVSLDPMVQAHVLDLVRKASASRGMAILHIAHDSGVVAEFADELMVMWNGKLVESGSVEEVFRAPQHAHTKELLTTDGGGAGNA
jgi:ABC-type dipeptide/oligopeptide/nickel transport system ATPase component